MAARKSIATIGAELQVKVTMTAAERKGCVVIGGNAYLMMTWEDLEKITRQPGAVTTYKGTETRTGDDWTEKAYRIFTVTAAGSVRAYNVAIEA